jgi:hypothetical protein
MSEAERPRAGSGAERSGTIANDNQPTSASALSLAELVYLKRGLSQPGGKLPLFDLNGQQVSPRIVRDCLARGLAEPWFPNPLKPDWLVCRLTPSGRQMAETVDLANRTIPGPL